MKEPVAITYQHEGAVHIGDILMTGQSAYLVVEARIMATRDGVSRWALRACQMTHEEARTFKSGKRLQLKWSPRVRRTG